MRFWGKQKNTFLYYLLYFTGFCGRPRTPGNVNLHGNSFVDGDVVTFTCAKNHDLVGDTSLRCVGQAWNSSVPECKGEYLVKKFFFFWRRNSLLNFFELLIESVSVWKIILKGKIKKDEYCESWSLSQEDFSSDWSNKVK